MALKGIRGIVYFCPDLRLYRYKCRPYDSVSGAEALGEEVDFKFDGDELEDTIVAHLASNDGAKEAEAKFVAHITGLARVNPHKVIEFDTGDDKIEVKEPGPYWGAHDKERADKEAAEEASSGGGGK